MDDLCGKGIGDFQVKGNSGAVHTLVVTEATCTNLKLTFGHLNVPQIPWNHNGYCSTEEVEILTPEFVAAFLDFTFDPADLTITNEVGFQLISQNSWHPSSLLTLNYVTKTLEEFALPTISNGDGLDSTTLRIRVPEYGNPSSMYCHQTGWGEGDNRCGTENLPENYGYKYDYVLVSASLKCNSGGAWGSGNKIKSYSTALTIFLDYPCGMLCFFSKRHLF